LRLERENRRRASDYGLGKSNARFCASPRDGSHFQYIVDPARLQKIRPDASYREGARLAIVDAPRKRRMFDARQSQKIGPAPLAPAKIGRVVNEAREIGVLEINANGKNMPPLMNMARNIGPRGFAFVFRQFLSRRG